MVVGHESFPRTTGLGKGVWGSEGGGMGRGDQGPGHKGRNPPPPEC